MQQYNDDQVVALRYFPLDKENFESYLDTGTTLTNKQWAEIADEIDGRTANFLDELLASLVIDIQEGVYDE